jgi:cation:H+ antiporter
MIENFVLLILFLILLVKSAEYATKYSQTLSKKFHISSLIVGFFIVAIISSLPEGTIAIISAIQGVPEFGLGTLIGSNVTDLLLVFGLAALFSGSSGIPVKSRILKKDFFYLAILFFPVLSGLDGNYSRLDGVILLAAGLSFFFSLYIRAKMFKKENYHLSKKDFIKNLALLIISLAVLIISSNYAIKYGVIFANDIHVPSILISLTIVSLGTCLPELAFSLKAVKEHHDELALGDVLGTVISDATIYVGIMALISPFSFDPLIIYITGFSMFFAGVISTIFINTDKTLSKKEGIYLLVFYGIYLIIEITANSVI